MQRFNAELKHICRRQDQLPLIAFVDKTKFATRTQHGECDPGEVWTTQKWAKNELTTLFGLAGPSEMDATSILLGTWRERRATSPQPQGDVGHKTHFDKSFIWHVASSTFVCVHLCSCMCVGISSGDL